MTPSAGSIAKAHFDAAMAAAELHALDQDAVARALLSLVVTSYLGRRSVDDVRTELLAAAENIDPGTDYTFMRP